ncbi:MAG: hypothetical protein WD557_19730 [Dehalococcoidia bacterium]
MTAKHTLMQLVKQMTEEDAEALLTEGRGLINGRRLGPESERQTLGDLAGMSLAEREPYLRSMYFEVDEDELREWDATLADGLDDDDCDRP